jgi:HEAT repeat protein
MHQDKRLPWRGLLLGALLVVLCRPAVAAEPAADDPLAGLRRALRQNRDVGGDADALAFRKRDLARQAAALHNLADLGRALVLPGWRHENLDPKAAEVDEAAWDKLAVRFTEAVRKAFEQGDPVEQQAVADLLAGLAGSGRANGVVVGPLHTRLADLAEPLARLSRQAKNGNVRAAALRTLGRIEPDPKVAAAALERALREDESAPRRAAADALVSLIEEASEAARLSRAGGPPAAPPGRNPPAAPAADDAPRRDALAAALQVVPVAGRVLADSDAQVRRRGAEAVRQAALLLQDAVAFPAPVDFPPPGRKPTAEERQQMQEYRARVEREWKELAPVAGVLGQQIPALDKVVADADLQASLAAGRALEGMADARKALSRWLGSVPAPAADEAAGRLAEDPLGPALKEAVPVLAKRLSADEVRARLASLYVLETLGPEAAPAAGEVVRALRDRDPFVRWGAARALGRMALKGEAAGKAVAGLAPLLKDDNADARLGAAAALQRYGAAARGAVAELSAAVKEGDDEVRLRAIAALAAIGPEAGKDAVAALVKALQAGEPDVRAAAAGALGQVAPGDKAAREALRKALDDPDAEVRGAASAALLRREGGQP